MSLKPEGTLRTGFTTGACATAAAVAAVEHLLTQEWPNSVTITLPKGQQVEFEVAHQGSGNGFSEAGIIKDAGDDPDVTHQALIRVRVAQAASGITFAKSAGR